MSLTLQRGALCRLSMLGERLRLSAAALSAMARTFNNRRQAMRVAELSDHLLKDVGLRRDDVHEALRVSWREDPTYVLALKAQENRCRR